MKIETFSGQAEEIHRKNIENYENAQEKIATDRIERFFNGQLQLGWKSILYEINKLPELSRTKYFQKLVEREKDSAVKIDREFLKQTTFLYKLKFLFTKGN